jgi:hypothetical protein
MAEQKTVAGAKPTKPKAQSHTNFPRDALCIDKRKHSLILIGAMAVQIQKKQDRGNSHLIVVDADEEEEGGVAPVHDLVVPVLHERTLPQQNHHMYQKIESEGKKFSTSRSKNASCPRSGP